MHYLFFYAIVLSFEKIPLLHCALSNSLLQWFVDISSNMFTVAINVAAPVMATLLFTSLVLGILAKTAPQMHIFIVAFPIKIAVGLLGVGLTLPMFAIVLKKNFAQLSEFFLTILKLAVA